MSKSWASTPTNSSPAQAGGDGADSARATAARSQGAPADPAPDLSGASRRRGLLDALTLPSIRSPRLQPKKSGAARSPPGKTIGATNRRNIPPLRVGRAVGSLSGRDPQTRPSPFLAAPGAI